MVRFITFCEMTPEFLGLTLEERQDWPIKWNKVALQYGVKMIFWGMPLGVQEHVVCVFETNGNPEKYFKFQREWLGLGTPEAGKYIKNTRTITVY
ncbi:hypothetical protein JXL21_07980 [Candidatus Bathyarchaeota archaeon]|nr:hypothetical protein [Candidatus Bathyarchaeota archaeon]